MAVFETSRIEYRLMTLNDTETVLRWRNSDFVRKQFLYQKEITPREHLEYYEKRIVSGETVQFIMTDKKSKRELGCIYLSRIDKNECTGEGGIFIGEQDFIGLGYGTEGYEGIKKYGFSILGLTWIKVRIRRTNIPSIRGCQKVGFEINENLLREYKQSGGKEDIVFLVAEKPND